MKDFLGPLIAASGGPAGGGDWRKNRTPNRTRLGGLGKKARISYRIPVEAGELNPRKKDRTGKKDEDKSHS